MWADGGGKRKGGSYGSFTDACGHGWGYRASRPMGVVYEFWDLRRTTFGYGPGGGRQTRSKLMYGRSLVPPGGPVLGSFLFHFGSGVGVHFGFDLERLQFPGK